MRLLSRPVGVEVPVWLDVCSCAWHRRDEEIGDQDTPISVYVA